MTRKEYNNAVDLFADNLFRFALKHLKNEMLANDVVQDTFTKVWIKHEEINNEKIKSYLFTTAYHAIVDCAKKENRSKDIVKSKEPSRHYEAEFNLQDVLNEALDILPEIQKTVVLLRDYEGYNYSEIAEITDLNESQVKVYIFRARKSLQQYLGSVEKVLG